MPAVMEVPEIAVAGEWEAMGAVSVSEAAMGIMSVVQEVPHEVIGMWRRAWVDLYEVWQGAIGTRQTDRALKWLLAMPQVLLRGPAKLRGGKSSRLKAHRAKTVRVFERRFNLWETGQRRQLVD